MTIESVLKHTINALEKGQAVYRYVVALMDEAEKSKQSGVAKKDTVMKLARDFIISLGKNWDDWAAYIFDFIDSAKSIYKAMRGLFA